jgi:uncharacterized protein HemX
MAGVRRILAAVGLSLSLLLVPASTVHAQDEPTTTSVAELPPANIIPRPNSGHAPTEAGDRGGALQLGLLALGVLALSGGAFHVWRQSRRAREAQHGADGTRR